MLKLRQLSNFVLKILRQHPYKNFTLLRPLFFQIISITVQETKICGNGKKKKIKINENLIDILDAE